MSLVAHRACFDAYSGAKVELKIQFAIDSFSPVVFERTHEGKMPGPNRRGAQLNR